MSADLLISGTSARNECVTQVRNEFYTHLRTRTSRSRGVRSASARSLRSRARNLVNVHHVCEWQWASTCELLRNVRARTFKTHYTVPSA